MWSYDEAMALARMVRQVNFFCVDEEDEFQVKRGDGSALGIFKTWAIPVIPFLDSGNIMLLWRIWPQLQNLGEKGLMVALETLAGSGSKDAIKALDVLEGWQNLCVNNPVRLERSLERARLNSWLLDRRLTEIFTNTPLKSGLAEQIRQLVNRLYLALGLLNPFYNLEAIAGNPESALGIDFSSETTSAGVLDAVAFLLVPAFRDIIVATRLDWNGLNWQLLHEKTEELLGDPKELMRGRILLNIARLAGAPPHHILFAANALEWIPSQVGGKKDDTIPTQEAIEKLDEALLRQKRDITALSVLADANALIRFLNWIPLIEGGKNFQGRNWTYDSAYTGDALLSLLSAHPEVWRRGFAAEFEQVLKPQLENLDAASAKGRLLLHLILVEGALKEEFFANGLDLEWQEKTVQQVTAYLTARNEVATPTKRLYPCSLVGSKTFGLALASYVLLENQIPDAFVISSDVISSLFRANPELWQRILQLDQEGNAAIKHKIAREVRQILSNLVFPEWFKEIILGGMRQFPQARTWSIRSSMQDEGDARGVHKSLLRIPTRDCLSATRKCMLSYYSRKALDFRMITGTDDFPDFAVLVHPYRRARGGTGTISEGEFAVEMGASAAKITAGVRTTVSEAKGKITDKGSTQAPPEILGTIDMLVRLETVFREAQIEWLGDAQENVVLLQMEFPSVALSGETEEEQRTPTHVYHISDLRQLEGVGMLLEEIPDALVKIELGNAVNLDSFQGKLLALIVRIGKRVVEIQLPQHVSPTSHLANICRPFGIKVSYVP